MHDDILFLKNEFQCNRVLDYGGNAEGDIVYKPGNTILNYGNIVCDMVVSVDYIDILEEYELQIALSDIKRCARKVAFLVVSTHEHDKKWWFKKLRHYFNNVSYKNVPPQHSRQYFVCTQ